MYHQSVPPRLEQHPPVADAQSPAGGEVYQTFHIAGHIFL